MKTPRIDILRIVVGLFLVAIIMIAPNSIQAQEDHTGHDHSSETHSDEPKMEAHDDHAEHDEEGQSEHSDEVKLSEDAIRLFGISTAIAEKKVLSDIAIAPARVAFNSEAMAHVGTQVQGRVEEIVVRLGDEVKEGDLLLVINSPEFGAAQSEFLKEVVSVEVAKINVEAAKTMADVARTAYERAEKLRESNGISITDYMERQGAMRQAEAELKKSEADLKVSEASRLASENQLHIFGVTHEQVNELLESGEISTRYEVRAPISGRVIEREVTPGEVVSPDEEALVVLANMENLWVIADVSERQSSRIVIGSIAHITLGALDNMTFGGVVSYVSPQLDSRTRTASVRVVVPTGKAADISVRTATKDMSDSNHADHDHDNEHDEHNHENEVTTRTLPDDEANRVISGNSASDLLKPGMFGKVEFMLSAPPGQQTIPVIAILEEAIQTVEGGPAVFTPVKGEPNTFALRPVKHGKRVGRWVPVIAGLNEGESYVASNSFILKAELGKEGAEHEH